MAAKLTVGFHISVVRYISGIAAAMNLKQHESGHTDFPCKAADMIAAEYAWIVLAAIIAAEIEFLVFFRQLEIVVVDIFFKVEICFIVLVLIEIAVFYAVDCYYAVVVKFCSRLRIDFGFSNGCVDTIPRAEQRERGVFNVNAVQEPAEPLYSGVFKHTYGFPL